MSHERHDLVFYDSWENDRFREGLLQLMANANETARQKAAKKGSEADLVMKSTEFTIGTRRAECDFYGEKSTGIVTVETVRFTKLDDPTDEALRLIHNDIQALPAMDDKEKAYFFNNFEALRTAQVDLFTRRTFQADLELGHVSVATDFGYRVDSLMIGAVPNVDDPLEQEQEGLFGPDDVAEVIRALHKLGLVKADQVRRFIDEQA